jgi:predicted DNA-binding protein (MmcQ/YjbR family)
MLSGPLENAESVLRELALAYPGAYEEFPWGHRAIKVKKKTFIFLARDDEKFSLSVKLPASSVAALMLPFASPTEYGLGKSGWVTARFGPDDEVPLELLGSWLDESYRALAPKKMVAQLPPAAEW